METYGFIENKVYAKWERGHPGQGPHPELFVANSEGILVRAKATGHLKEMKVIILRWK